MITQNGETIQGCEVCGRDDLVASELILRCEFGSKNDMEQLTLNICGDCADRFYEIMTRKG